MTRSRNLTAKSSTIICVALFGDNPLAWRRFAWGRFKFHTSITNPPNTEKPEFNAAAYNRKKFEKSRRGCGNSASTVTAFRWYRRLSRARRRSPSGTHRSRPLLCALKMLRGAILQDWFNVKNLLRYQSKDPAAQHQSWTNWHWQPLLFLGWQWRLSESIQATYVFHKCLP